MYSYEQRLRAWLRRLFGHSWYLEQKLGAGQS